jgi:hypothetical protein
LRTVGKYIEQAILNVEENAKDNKCLQKARKKVLIKGPPNLITCHIKQTSERQDLGRHS